MSTPLRQLVRAVDEAIAAGGIVLVGEVHDNAIHHRLRAELIRRSAPKRPALVFEHIPTDRGSALDGFNHAASEILHGGPSPHHRTADDLLAALEWSNSGWPAAGIFKPLFEAALSGRLPIVPGDPPRALVRKVAKEGSAALADGDRARRVLDSPLPGPLQSALLDELEASHCGLMPRAALANMAFAQRYRDAHLADALVQAATIHGSAILLAGNGHVRADRGVPLYLRQMVPARMVVAVMLLEVEDGKTDPGAYAPRDPDGKLAADFVLFTPRASRDDPCESMRRQLAPAGR